MQELTMQEIESVSGGDASDWANVIGISSGVGALGGAVLSPTATAAGAAMGTGAALGAAIGVAFMGGYTVGTYIYDAMSSGTVDFEWLLKNMGIIRP